MGPTAQKKKPLIGEAVSVKAMKYPALNISAATTELVTDILTLYPHAQILPRLIPLEDEDISLEVRLPLRQDDIYEAREQLHAFVIQLQEQYEVLILASAVST